MTAFLQSASCRLGLHCPVCRDRIGGRAWRESLAAAFELPSDAPDFACPHGRWWGYRSRGRIKRLSGLGDLVALLAHVLGIRPWAGCGCTSRQAALNALFPFDQAEWGRRLTRRRVSTP
jgi:hypothetical protein